MISATYSNESKVTVRTYFKNWKSLGPDAHDYLLIYAWGFIWSLMYLLFYPAATTTILAHSVVFGWTLAAMVGAVMAILGLVLRDNLLIERFGITLMMVAPIVYALTQLALLILSIAAPGVVPLAPGAHVTDRLPIIFLGLWPLFWLNKRRHQIKRQVRSAKEAPLEGESK